MFDPRIYCFIFCCFAFAFAAIRRRKLTLQNVGSDKSIIFESPKYLGCTRGRTGAFDGNCYSNTLRSFSRDHYLQGRCVLLQESFHLGSRRQEETLTVERIHRRGSGALGGGLKLSLSCSSGRFVALTCPRVAERG